MNMRWVFMPQKVIHSNEPLNSSHKDGLEKKSGDNATKSSLLLSIHIRGGQLFFGTSLWIILFVCAFPHIGEYKTFFCTYRTTKLHTVTVYAKDWCWNNFDLCMTFCTASWLNNTSMQSVLYTHTHEWIKQRNCLWEIVNGAFLLSWKMDFLECVHRKLSGYVYIVNTWIYDICMRCQERKKQNKRRSLIYLK